MGKKTVGEALIFSGVEQWSARESHKLEVTGSNPVTATNFKLNMMIEKLAELLNVAQITEDYRGHPDLTISEWLTADGYDVHVMTNDERNLDFEYDVFYYQPDFDSIIERIKDLDSEAIVYVSDIETYLPEYEVNEYIEQHTDDE